ncbi:hypothetical protein HHI36_016749 [Cryptolaemus montrouzieri]|uniref:Uncharacterized protein n=1 Tax=Cryptolaemus montrouzieri TaxID=559131 RepID=A0ABD2NLP6_9CUCU
MNFELNEDGSCADYYPHNSTMLSKIDQELLQQIEKPYQHFKNGLLKKKGMPSRKTTVVDHILLVRKHSSKKTNNPVPDLYAPRFYEEFVAFHT